MEKIQVTKTFLPPIEEYREYLDRIWSTSQLTNQGPLLKEFEEKLKGYLGVEQLHFVANGTIALQLALNALDITEGEIITTPFSYVATTSAVLWERCKPIFVDIDPCTFCINPDKIEEVITKDTRAILAVHVFGFPCDVEKIEAIAKKHSLKVIYDGAHAFGVKYKGKPLLSYGDISTCSFHSTKVFHTIEGGCIITKDKKVSEKLELTKRFGHYGDDHRYLGINAKASEFQAAMGLCNFKYIDDIRNSRKEICEYYDGLLSQEIYRLKLSEELECNYSYYPVVFKNKEDVSNIIKALNEKEIYPRRYFYPSLNRLPYLPEYKNCPISENISDRVLCLPLYVGLKKKDIEDICVIINQKMS